MIFQNPYASLNPRRTVSHTIAEPAEVHATIGDVSETAFVADCWSVWGCRRVSARDSARALGWSAPEGRDRPRALAVRPEATDRRRSGQRTGRPCPGADPQPPRQPPDRSRSHDALHLSPASSRCPHRGSSPRSCISGGSWRSVRPTTSSRGRVTRTPSGYSTRKPGRHRRGRKPAVDRRVSISTDELLREGCSYRDRCPPSHRSSAKR